MVGEEGRVVLACCKGEYGQLGSGTREHQRGPANVSGLTELQEGALTVIVAANGLNSAARTSEGEGEEEDFIQNRTRVGGADLGLRL